MEFAARANIISTIALQAGKLAVKYRDTGLNVSSKGRQDFVTQADLAVETLITEQLLEHFPNDGVLGEEHGTINPNRGTWVVDPIDGTSNYIKNMDYWCVSIAYVVDDEIQIGCIYAPDRDEMYLAIKNKGATLNAKPLQLKPTLASDEAVIGIGVSGRSPLPNYLDLITYLIENGLEYRRFGSAALTLAHVAAGQVDGYFEAHLNSWDATAGLLIACEAGALGNEFLAQNGLNQGNITLAAHPKIYPQLAHKLL
jgi:myo-inositol-1(or 4)-monophosphatase